MSKKKQSDQLEQSEFCIIKGGKDDDTYGLGDPCIPLDISYLPVPSLYLRASSISLSDKPICFKTSLEGISEGFKSLGLKLDGIKLCVKELNEFPEISIWALEIKKLLKYKTINNIFLMY